jgi:membrane protein DedA with SNARE-associated domain
MERGWFAPFFRINAFDTLWQHGNMHQMLEFLVRHGYGVLFAWVFAEQIGLPLPSVPILIAMGALTGLGDASFLESLSLVLVAALTADSGWYVLGRKKGHSVLKLLCRISLEPDSCVSSTRQRFKKLGAWTLVLAKFVPGLSAVATPMAGLSRMNPWKFAAADSAGILLWGSILMGVGYVFRDQLEDTGALAVRLGSWLVVIVAGVIGLWIGAKLYQRKRFLKTLRVARITPQEVLSRLTELVIVDLRAQAEVEWDGMKLPGALWFDRAELEARAKEIPRDRDVVLYCT